MRSGRAIVYLLFGAVWLHCGGVGDAYALSACTAADVIRQDPGCPAGTALCQVTKTFEVADGCELDFGTRPVAIAATGGLAVGSRRISLRAGSLTIAAGGSIDARGNRPPPGDRGGLVTIATTGAVTLQGATGSIDASGDSGGGMIVITAGGSVTVFGKLLAKGLIGSAGPGWGGEIRIVADGDILTHLDSQISATGERSGGGGGTVDLRAGGRVQLGELLDVSGSEGGALYVFSDGEIVAGEVKGRGSGDAGSGGCLDLEAGTTLRIQGPIDFNGTGSSQGFGGGCGGFICLTAGFGDLQVMADVDAEGASPDGGGGSITIVARGSVGLQSGTTISVRGNGVEGYGGELCVETDDSLIDGAFLDASGGLLGGDLEITARRNVTVGGGIDASGRAVASEGGSAFLEAGADGFGTLSIESLIDVGARGCSDQEGTGVGGFAQLMGCDVQLTPAGSVLARAPVGGDTDLIAREQLTVRGTINATTSNESCRGSSDGTNSLTYPTRKPVIRSGPVQPTPVINALGTCADLSQADCLLPCPVCGNGVTEFPETCDNNVGTPVSCDGCSALCRLEDCNDGLICTIDSCNSQLGCRHQPAAPPSTRCEEPPTPTRTVTPTRTITSTATSTATAPTRTVTPTRTITSIATSTATATPSGTSRATPSPSRTPTASGLPTDTPTATETPTDTPTLTPTPPCVGDCGGGGQVSIDELIRGVNIALGARQVSDCLNFDRNRDQQVSVDELIAGVNNALYGCGA